MQHQSPHFQGRVGKNSWRLSEVTIENLKTAIIFDFFLKIQNFSQLWQHREKVVLHNRLELWLWRLGQVTKVTISLLLWNIGSRFLSWFDFVSFVTLDKKDPFPVFYPLTSHRYSNNPWSYEACSGGGSVPSNFIRSGWICNKQFSTFSHFNHLWLILHQTHWK